MQILIKLLAIQIEWQHVICFYFVGQKKKKKKKKLRIS